MQERGADQRVASQQLRDEIELAALRARDLSDDGGSGSGDSSDACSSSLASLSPEAGRGSL
eukprot:5887067-Pyramimonas_sp.AAC.1